MQNKERASVSSSGSSAPSCASSLSGPRTANSQDALMTLSPTNRKQTATFSGTIQRKRQRSSGSNYFLQALTRKKPLDGRTDTHLNRCLNLLDLTTLGVGSTLGLGLYVLAGQVASNKAGPAVVISFALAALASTFSALCYAEFAGRVPRAGSAYAYSYIAVGEFVAFIIGWNLILEYVIGASSVARGFSGYLRFVCQHIVSLLSATQSHGPVRSSNDHQHNNHSSTQISGNNSVVAQTDLLPSAVDGTIRQLVVVASGTVGQLVQQVNMSGHTSNAQLNWYESIGDYVWRYFDWISIAIVVILTIFILFGVKESTNLTLAFTAVNMTVVIVVVLSSLGSLDLHNWQLSKAEIPSSGAGDGGFMPFGWSGVLAGSATCFFGFIGFDTIASSAEEAKNPKRNVPLSIVLSLFISFLAYMAIAIVQTLLWPYYAQDNITILPYIFAQLNMPFTYWIVLLGAIAGLASSQLGGMYPLPRILYSMAQDKLIYSSLAHVDKRLKLPVYATIVGSVFVALLACLLDIQDLADMVSIGTLAAYSLVSLSVLIIRYEDRDDSLDDSTLISGRLRFQDILNVETQPGTKARDQISIFDKEDWKSANDIKSEGNTILVPVVQMAHNNLGNKQFIMEEKETRVRRITKPTDATSQQSKLYIVMIVVLTILLNLVAISLTSWTIESKDSSQISSTDTTSDTGSRTLLVYTGGVLILALVVVVYLLSKLPNGITEKHRNMFMVPLVPLTPVLSILVNTFLMLNLSCLTWIRFAVWMTIGLFIYFSYGVWHSRNHFLRLDRSRNSDDGRSSTREAATRLESPK